MQLGDKRTLQGQWVVSHYYGSGPSIVFKTIMHNANDALMMILGSMLEKNGKRQVRKKEKKWELLLANINHFGMVIQTK